MDCTLPNHTLQTHLSEFLIHRTLLLINLAKYQKIVWKIVFLLM